MEEEIEPTQDYIDSFNLGYMLNKVAPEIVELVDHLQYKGTKLVGLKAGINQAEAERLESIAPEWLKDNPSQRDELGFNDLDKDIEPEL